MGSVAIPLQVQQPQIESPLQTIGGLMQLRQGMTELALKQAQIQQANQATQNLQAEQTQKNRDIADVNNYTAIMKDPSIQKAFGETGDISAFQKAGIQPKFIDSIVKSRQDQLAGAATLDKDTLTNRADALKQLKETAVNLAAPDADGNPPDIDTINSRYQSAKTGLAPLYRLAGITSPMPSNIDSPESLKQIQANLQGAEAIHTAALAHKETQAKTAASEATATKDKADAVEAQAQADHLKATLPKDEADAAVAKLEADFAKTHNGLKPSEAETVRHNKATEATAQGELGIKQKTFEATLGSGLDANGQPLSPEAMKASAMSDPTALAIAHYQIPPPPATTRGGLPNPVLRKVLAINPQYDATTYPARAETAKGFSPSGQQGQAITAADTALAHLNTLSAAGAALKNGDLQAINRVANAIGAQVGSTPKATYDTILNMVGPEISKAVIGAVGGEGERAGTAANFTSNLSDAQRESNIGAAVNLLGARFDKANHAYEAQMGVPLPRTLSPESQSIRQKYSPSTPGKTVTKQDVQDYATKHSLSYADAESHVKANGFTVQ